MSVDPALEPEVPIDEPVLLEPVEPYPLVLEPVLPVLPVLPGLPVVPPLVVPPDCANAAPAASIEIIANRFHHVCMRKRSR
jgi:hypothetical protein